MTSTKAHIAVVDDDPSVLKSLARLLRSVGYSVQAFGSARAFLDSLNLAEPQCLVLDVQLPDMNGFELQAQLQQRGYHIPIVFITAHDSPQTRAAAQLGSSLGLFLKPFEDVSFLATIGNVITPGGYTAVP